MKKDHKHSTQPNTNIHSAHVAVVATNNIHKERSLSRNVSKDQGAQLSSAANTNIDISESSLAESSVDLDLSQAFLTQIPIHSSVDKCSREPNNVQAVREDVEDESNTHEEQSLPRNVANEQEGLPTGDVHPGIDTSELSLPESSVDYDLGQAFFNPLPIDSSVDQRERKIVWNLNVGSNVERRNIETVASDASPPSLIVVIMTIATIFGLGDITARTIRRLNDMDAKKRRGYASMCGIALIGLYLMIGYGAQFLCNFIGFVYPAYCSIKAIESTSKDDDTQWLTYWVVYSCFHLVEFFSDIFLFWIPFYWFFKCCFLVWCFANVPWNGSNFLYTKFIRPFILRHQDKIDTALDKAKGAAMEASDLAKEIASDEVIRRAAASVTKED